MLIVVKNELILYQHRSVSGLASRPAPPNVMFCIAEDVCFFTFIYFTFPFIGTVKDKLFVGRCLVLPFTYDA